MDESDPPFPFPGTPESVEAMKRFTLAYGMALAAWAQLEDRMCLAFNGLVAVPHKMARGLFFSGRSFATRADLYAAAITHANVNDTCRRAHKYLLKKARRYSSSRNSIAHGTVMHLIGGGPYEGYRVKKGQQSFERGGIGENDLLVATKNFSGLTICFFKLALAKSDDIIEECLAQARELPTLALPHEPTPTDEGSE